MGFKVDPDLKSGDSDQCIIYIALCTKNYEIRTNPKSRQLFDPNDASVIAYGELVAKEAVSGEEVGAVTSQPCEGSCRCGTKEPGGTFQDGIDTTQIILVLRIQIVFPQMGTQPSATGIGSSPGGVFTGSGIIPYVGHHVEYPAICLIAIESMRTCFSRRDKALHQRCQRLIEFGKTGLFQRPVVHLDIDVRMIVPVPRSRYSICPESLQIGRQTAGRVLLMSR